MEIRVADIVNTMEKWAPLNMANPDDNVGLLIGRENAVVKRVFVSLDADVFAIEEAIQFRADLIVCHHPLIFRPISRINDERILRLIENNIALYVAHTNVDWTEGGVNDLLCEKYGICDVKPLEGDHVARYGSVGPITLGDLMERIGDGVSRYVGDKSQVLRKIAVCGGGGGYLVGAAINQGCDAYVTADIRYHEAQMAAEAGIALIDAGHFEMENIIVEPIANYIKMIYNIDVKICSRIQSCINYE